MKLSDYTEEEKRAVFDHYWADTTLEYERISEEHMLAMLNTTSGAIIVFGIRLRNLGVAVADAFRGKKPMS